MWVPLRDCFAGGGECDLGLMFVGFDSRFEDGLIHVVMKKVGVRQAEIFLLM